MTSENVAECHVNVTAKAAIFRSFSGLILCVTALLLATRNPHKTREIQEILGHEFDVEDLSGHPEIRETIESGKTFAENALLKAIAASKQHPGLVIGDDSGLEVDAVGGAPGIFSARYAGKGASDKDNLAKLLRELAGRGTLPGQWRARFRCVIALARNGKSLETFNGVAEGRVVDTPRGKNGFGLRSDLPTEWFQRNLCRASIRYKESHQSSGDSPRTIESITSEAILQSNITTIPGRQALEKGT